MKTRAVIVALLVASFAAFIGYHWYTFVAREKAILAETSTRAYADLHPQEQPTVPQTPKEYTMLYGVTTTAYSPRESCLGGIKERCVTASGTKVYEGIVAMNCVPFGTKVKIFGVSYTVQDRLPERKGCNHVDIYHDSWDEAIQYGVQTHNIEVYRDNTPNA